jgi:hypothetical protein
MSRIYWLPVLVLRQLLLGQSQMCCFYTNRDGANGRNCTYNLLLRSEPLYLIELHTHRDSLGFENRLAQILSITQLLAAANIKL